MALPIRPVPSHPSRRASACCVIPFRPDCGQRVAQLFRAVSPPRRTLNNRLHQRLPRAPLVCQSSGSIPFSGVASRRAGTRRREITESDSMGRDLAKHCLSPHRDPGNRYGPLNRIASIPGAPVPAIDRYLSIYINAIECTVLRFLWCGSLIPHIRRSARPAGVQGQRNRVRGRCPGLRRPLVSGVPESRLRRRRGARRPARD
jgi:hypothetical protein